MTSQPKQQSDSLSVALQPAAPEEIENLLQILDDWMVDESGYDEETWDELKENLDLERVKVGARRLFIEI